MKGPGRWKDKARRHCPERGEHKVLDGRCTRVLAAPALRDRGAALAPATAPAPFGHGGAGGADVRCQESVLASFLTEWQGLSAQMLFPCRPGGTVSSELGVVFALVSVRGPLSGVGCPWAPCARVVWWVVSGGGPTGACSRWRICFCISMCCSAV